MSVRIPSSLCLIAVLAAFAGLLGGCASQEPVKLKAGEEVELQGTTFSADLMDANYALFSDYRIHAGDVLDVLFQIRTWIRKERFEVAVDHEISIKFPRAPELNEAQRVRPDGHISLPYIGEYLVAGKTVDEIQKELLKLYAKELRDPELYVVILEYREAIKELKHDLHTSPRGLSRLVTVRPDGKVTFPMMGEMRVAGRTVTEVNEALNLGYEKILPGLHVDLFLEKHSGSTIYVMGEVNRPGAYPIVKPISLLHALTLAESYTPGARLDSIIVVRRRGQQMAALRVDLEETLTFQAGSKLFFLRPDDIILVPKTRLHHTAEVARQVADILFFRGWGFNFSSEEVGLSF